MNKEIAKEWIEELRSGRHIQGKEILGRATPEGRELCCLGVLCVVAERHNLIDGPVIENGIEPDGLLWDGEGYLLPKKVRDWAEIGDHSGAYRQGRGSLSYDNDSGKSFAEIADIIETHAEDL